MICTSGLGAKNQKKWKKIDGNNVELTFGDNNKVVVNNNVFHLSRDPVIAEGLQRVTNPLRQAEIERIVLKYEGKEQVAIEKPEATYFEAASLQLEAGNSPMEGQKETVLIVSKVSFVEGTTWTLIEEGATLTAKIEDPEFWAKVHQTNLRFGEGDRLRCFYIGKSYKPETRSLFRRTLF